MKRLIFLIIWIACIFWIVTSSLTPWLQVVLIVISRWIFRALGYPLDTINRKLEKLIQVLEKVKETS